MGETAQTELGTGLAAKDVEYLGGGVFLGFCIFLCRDLECVVKVLFQWCADLKLSVVLNDLFGFGVIKPTAFARIEGGHHLGIELKVIDGMVDMDGGGEFYAYETATTGGVGQDVVHVGGGDK